MANPIILRKVGGTWTLRAGGSILAESTQALELTEQTGSTQIHFPKNDIAMALLEPSDHTTDYPQKGTAQYFPIITKSTTLENVAWGYANPSQAVATIEDHLTFQTSDHVTVEQI